MTLSTDLIICEPVDPRSVFDHALGLLATAVDFDPTWDYTPAGQSDVWTNAHYVSTVGQGLPAWLFLHHATDAPLIIWDDERLRDMAEYDGITDFVPPWFDQHLIRVDFDTAYGYRGPHGGGCGDLHAWLVSEMAMWLADEKRVTKVVWLHESTGEYFPPADIAKLGSPGLGRLTP